MVQYYMKALRSSFARAVVSLTCFLFCFAVEKDAGDDCQDAGPDAEAGRWRGGEPSYVKDG